MAIKKAYKDIVELLHANDDQLVADILPQVVALASAKAGGGGSRATTFHKNDDGVVVGIKCYYYGVWMSPEVVDFGKKASSTTGLNSMCKEGMSLWTKQQSVFKKAKEGLLDRVMSGELAQEDVAAAKEELEEAKNFVAEREDGYGFNTLEELLEDNANRGLAH